MRSSFKASSIYPGRLANTRTQQPEILGVRTGPTRDHRTVATNTIKRASVAAASAVRGCSPRTSYTRRYAWKRAAATPSVVFPRAAHHTPGWRHGDARALGPALRPQRLTM